MTDPANPTAPVIPDVDADLPFDVIVPSSGDAALAETLDDALYAAAKLQKEAQESRGIARPFAYIYENDELVVLLTRPGGRP